MRRNTSARNRGWVALKKLAREDRRKARGRSRVMAISSVQLAQTRLTSTFSLAATRCRPMFGGRVTAMSQQTVANGHRQGGCHPAPSVGIAVSYAASAPSSVAACPDPRGGSIPRLPAVQITLHKPDQASDRRHVEGRFPEHLFHSNRHSPIAGDHSPKLPQNDHGTEKQKHHETDDKNTVQNPTDNQFHFGTPSI